MFDQKLSPASDYGGFLLIFTAAAVGFLAYFYFTRSSLLQKLFEKAEESRRSSLSKVLFQRAAGVVFLGIFPGISTCLLLGIRIRDYGLAQQFDPAGVLWILGSGFSALLAGFLISKLVENHRIYPQIRIKSWGWPLIMMNALSWTAYLLAYEFLFRGIVLFASLKAVGYWPAVFLNTVLYALAHWPKGIKEALGAVPFGIFLCLITLETGAIWAALTAHVCLALSHDHFSLLSHPDMRYTCGNRRQTRRSFFQ